MVGIGHNTIKGINSKRYSEQAKNTIHWVVTNGNFVDVCTGQVGLAMGVQFPLFS